MLILIFLTLLVTNISVIKCKDNDIEIVVEINESANCLVNSQYHLSPGSNVIAIVKNAGNRKIQKLSIDTAIYDNTKNFNGGGTPVPSDKDYLEIIEIVFRQNSNTPKIQRINIPNGGTTAYKIFFKVIYYQYQIHPMCNTTIIFDVIQSTTSLPIKENKNKDNWHTYMAICGVVAGIIIIALSVTTMYYKRQANMLNKHINLERRTEKSEENDRYCSNPRKAKNLINKTQHSVIYEDPQITLGLPAVPPPLPNSPRPIRSGVSTLRTPSSASMSIKNDKFSHPTFPRCKTADSETKVKMSMAQRPPIPLPQEEVYEETEQDETYEEPPIPERPPHLKKPSQQNRGFNTLEKLPKAPMEIPGDIARPRPEKLAKRFGKTLPNIPMDGLKPGVIPPLKPVVPKNKPTPPRNKVVQLPIHEIPETSSLKKEPVVKPKPNAKPNKPPAPTLHQEDEFDHNNRDSTDDEFWTYEPLKQYHIYNN